MAKQEVRYIDLKDLVLWTENPRDPIDRNAKDQNIVDRALADKYSKWSLNKLGKDMGSHYDLSELPTVVYHGKKPIVYDGNRRVILGKIKNKYVSIPASLDISIPDFPEKIPCNVCDEKTALQNVYRKHSDTGSWLPLERDIFLHKFMGEKKSSFLIIEEDTGLISSNPHLNKRYVKEEVFTDSKLNELGFSIKRNRLYSVHNDADAYSILSDISKKIENNILTTRGENRGKVRESLDPTIQQLIDKNRNNEAQLPKISFVSVPEEEPKKVLRQARRTNKKASELFGGKLYLRGGEVSNLYRDIMDLYEFYRENKDHLSLSFSGLIRMSLRLLCETAATDVKKKFDDYLKGNFAEAKSTLDQNIKTSLSNQNVREDTIIQLLHTGAHNYQSSNNIEQTLAMSIIIGSILTITHGKEE